MTTWANCSGKWLGGATWWAAEKVRHTLAMGFNPFRPQRRRTSDYAFVAAAFVVTAALLLWALLPR
ncbi:MAG TPA: hypothetical protein VHG90_06715 [Acidimicrobiales bacterium]|nr:hypothetical protein [Acidimicrobiales bacterium]